MKRLVLTIAILLGLAAPAWAGYAEGYAAYERGDYATALREWRPLANQGDADAQTALGIMYGKGRGVPQDYAKALKWYRKAAAQGDGGAQSNLGALYYYGRGVPQDYAGAAKWYRKAANQGNAIGQTNLGITYYKGQGVLQDYVQAYMWFNLAVSNLAAGAGRDKTVKARDIVVAAKMTPAQIAEAQRRAREWKPKKEGK